MCLGNGVRQRFLVVRCQSSVSFSYVRNNRRFRQKTFLAYFAYSGIYLCDGRCNSGHFQFVESAVCQRRRSVLQHARAFVCVLPCVALVCFLTYSLTVFVRQTKKIAPYLKKVQVFLQNPYTVTGFCRQWQHCNMRRLACVLRYQKIWQRTGVFCTKNALQTNTPCGSSNAYGHQRSCGGTNGIAGGTNKLQGVFGVTVGEMRNAVRIAFAGTI